MKKVAAPGLENRDLTAVGTRCADHVTPLYPQKLALTSPTGGGRSVGIVRVRTRAAEFNRQPAKSPATIVKPLKHGGSPALERKQACESVTRHHQIRSSAHRVYIRQLQR